MRNRILCLILIGSLGVAGTASAAVDARMSFTRILGIPTGVCGDTNSCPTRPDGGLALAQGQRAVTAELASEDLPTTVTITECSRVGRAEIQCDVAVGPITYGPLGCVPGTACSPPQTVNSQLLHMFARRVGRDRVLVWYGPGKPEGISYIAAL